MCKFYVVIDDLCHWETLDIKLGPERGLAKTGAAYNLRYTTGGKSVAQGLHTILNLTGSGNNSSLLPIPSKRDILERENVFNKLCLVSM